VASALGRIDVDEIYDRGIRPVLKDLRMKVDRVDRKEHNDDIDDKIMELLQGADFCIADLTYARPSVYYEAGYAAASGKPVIYIARSDHFPSKDKIPADSERIHFDVQMKNIIPWTRPNITFSRRLRARVQFVTQPLMKALAQDESTSRDRAEFDLLSQHKQRVAIVIKAANLLRARGFSCEHVRRVDEGWVDHPSVLARRHSEGMTQTVRFLCLPSILKKELTSYYLVGLAPFNLGVRSGPVEGHYILASLRPIRESSVADALSYFDVQEDGSFVREYRQNLEGERFDHPRKLYFHFIAPVKSVSEFSGQFRELIDSHNLGKI
jgi:hypothetical protein